jgi:hypothetical protein
LEHPTATTLMHRDRERIATEALKQTAMSAFGTSRHFSATQQFSRFWSKADIQRAVLIEPDL